MHQDEIAVLKTQFQLAAEVASVVPESMQSKAFELALYRLGTQSVEEPKQEAISEKKEKSKTKSRQGRQGPQNALRELLNTGFFATEQMCSNVQSELKTKFGLNCKSKDLSKGMLRLVRSRELTRHENPQGEYTYKKA